MIMAGLLLTATICAAQTLTESERTHHNAFSTVPKELSLDAKPYMAVVEYDLDSDKSSMGIYASFGPDGSVLKFDVPNVPSADSYFEKVSGYQESVVIRNKFYDRMDYQNTYKDSSLLVIEAGVKRAYGYKDGFHLTEFTDPDGEKGYYGNDYSRYDGDSTRCFYEYEKYGKMYPMEFFVVDTAGILMHCHFFNYEMAYDFTNATWVKDLDYTRSYWSGYNEYSCMVQSVRFQNMDDSFFPNSNITASQNIFNKDKDWEYILIDFENYQQYETPQDWFEDGVVRRRVNQIPVFKNYIIMSSDGKQLLSIPIPDKADEHTISAEIEFISVMNGIIYLNTREIVRYGSLDSYSYTYDNCESMYAIEPQTTSVQTVSRKTVSRMSIDASAVSQGNSLGIHVAEPADGDNIVISSMAGQVINQTPVGSSEHISIETSSYPKGIYNVTLQNGSTPENRRIIIK